MPKGRVYALEDDGPYKHEVEDDDGEIVVSDEAPDPREALGWNDEYLEVENRDKDK